MGPAFGMGTDEKLAPPNFEPPHFSEIPESVE